MGGWGSGAAGVGDGPWAGDGNALDGDESHGTDSEMIGTPTYCPDVLTGSVCC